MLALLFPALIRCVPHRQKWKGTKKMEEEGEEEEEEEEE